MLEKKLYVGYDIWRIRGGQELSEETYSDKADEYCDNKLYGVFKDKNSIKKAIMWEEFFVPEEVYNGSTIFLIAIVYTTGDTFGISYGHLAIADWAATKKEAEEIMEKTEKKSSYQNRIDGYSWNGYFESIEEKYIEEFKIQK